MRGDRRLLEERRDQALRDIVELDRQVDAGEIPDGHAEPLRARYQAEAAEALGALDHLPDPEPDRSPSAPLHRKTRSWSRTAGYVGAALAALLAVGTLLPASLAPRPPGGAVSGGQARRPPPGPAQDLSALTDDELEAAVAANPQVSALRLTLAHRYLDQGRYDKAVTHYRKVLAQDQGNADALAGMGWVLFELGRPGDGLASVDRALAADPALPDALWAKANIEFYARHDPTAALAALDRMRQVPGLTATVRAQVDALARTVTGQEKPERR